jgi:hypothetical protein
MARQQNVISIPKPPREAFNKHRPVSELVWSQVEHLAAVVKKDIDDERRAISTEAQASAFIKRMTAHLHPDGAKKRTRSEPSVAKKKKARSSKR